MTSTAPIALFVYNRPSHTQETLAHLRSNPESCDSDLIIFSDGARSLEDSIEVRRTRELIGNVSGFRSVRVVNRAENWGLARSIIAGVTEVFEASDRIIVLEDDMITSPHFLRYMNAALERYFREDRVGSVHAYMYPIPDLPDFFFMRGGDCWGWGTWRDRWSLMESDGRLLLRALLDKGIANEFNRTGGDAMLRMLIDQIQGKNSSWFIRWHASLFINQKLTLQPGKSFIQNIGTDDSGTHCKTSNVFDVLPQQVFSGLPVLETVEDHQSVEKIRSFFRRNRNMHWCKWILFRAIDEFKMRWIAQYG